MGGQRGTEIEVDLSGARLGDAQEILFYQPGITTAVAPRWTTTASRRSSRSPPTPAWACTTSASGPPPGISELRTFSVGALKEINEVEPNNEFAKPAGRSR